MSQAQWRDRFQAQLVPVRPEGERSRWSAETFAGFGRGVLDAVKAAATDVWEASRPKTPDQLRTEAKALHEEIATEYGKATNPVEGVRNVANLYNPLYQGALSVRRALEAVENGDARTYAREFATAAIMLELARGEGGRTPGEGRVGVTRAVTPEGATVRAATAEARTAEAPALRQSREAAPEIPRGMSLNEVREPLSHNSYHAETTPTVPKQPGADWVGGERRESVTQTTDRKGTIVHHSIEGGEWIAGKRLHEDAVTPPEQRVRSNVDDAMKKFETPVRTGVSSRSVTMDDGTRYRMTLTNPQSLLVHVEVPGFDTMSVAQRANLQRLAEERVADWAPGGRYEGLPIRAQVRAAP